MAGFLALTRRGPVGLIAALATLLAAPFPVFAQMTNMAPAEPAPMSASAPMAPAKPGAVPPAPEDDFQRYGKILTAGNEPSHPLKLSMPFPDVGQVKIPTAEELAMRDKIEQLALLSDDEIRQQLIQWPAFSKMSLSDDATMLSRIQTFRDYRKKMAQDEWHRLGLTLNPEQQARFEKDFWNRKLQMDRQLAQQLDGAYKAAQQKLNEDLYREFSTPGPLAKAPPKPPTLTNAGGTTVAH